MINEEFLASTKVPGRGWNKQLQSILIFMFHPREISDNGRLNVDVIDGTKPRSWWKAWQGIGGVDWLISENVDTEVHSSPSRQPLVSV